MLRVLCVFRFASTIEYGASHLDVFGTVNFQFRPMSQFLPASLELSIDSKMLCDPPVLRTAADGAAPASNADGSAAASNSIGAEVNRR